MTILLLIDISYIYIYTTNGTCPHHFLSIVSPSASPTQVYETPFFVAVDHEKKKVVISIRGTLSLKVTFPLELLFFSPLVLSGY